MTYLLAKKIAFQSFAGNATAIQQTMLFDWLQTDANRETYFGWIEEWERQNPQFLPDTDYAYRKLLGQQPVQAVQSAETLPSVFKGKWIFTKFNGLVAAGIALTLLAGTYLLKDRIQFERYQTAYGQVQTYALKDGSRVTLNANSLLLVPRFNFGEGTREVWLKGEAEFSVSHLVDHQRFIVHTPDQLEVQVLGTKFVVYSRERGSKVVLSEGRVQLRYMRDLSSKPLVIAPGDIVTLSKQGRLRLHHQASVAQYSAWRDHRFQFEDTPVAEIAYQLTEQFGVSVLVPDSTLSHRTLGGTFKVYSAHEMLQVMAQMLNAYVTEQPANSSAEGKSAKTYVLNPLP